MQHCAPAPTTGRRRHRTRAASVVAVILASTPGASGVAAAASRAPQIPGPADSVRAGNGPASADLAIRSSAPARTIAGDTVVYSIQLINIGPADARGVVVSDRLPAAGTFLSASRGGVESGGIVTWPEIDNVPAGTARSFVVRFIAGTGSAGAELEQHASAYSATPDPNPLNNDVLSITALSAAGFNDLKLDKAGPATTYAGSTLTWTISLTNNGPGAATNVTVADTLPANVTYVSAPGATLSGRVLTWPKISTLPAGSTVSFAVTAAVPVCAGPIVNKATASLPDNTLLDSVTTICESPAPQDVKVTKTAADTVFSGNIIVYSIEVANAGPGSAKGVMLTDSLPAGGTFVSASGGGMVSGRVVTWPAVPDLPAGAAQVYTVQFRVSSAPAVCGPIVNVAAAQLAGGADSNPADNRSEAVTVVLCRRADLEVRKQGPVTVPGRPPPDSLEYAIQVVNLGPDTAVDVVLKDILPPAPAGDVVRISGGGVRSGAEIVWPVVPRLAPLDTLRYSVWYRWPRVPQDTGSITNTAIVASGPVPGDPNPKNDTSRVTTTISPRPGNPDLGILKTGPATAGAGDTLLYRIRVRNLGSETAVASVVTDTLPARALFVDATGGATPTGRVVTWTIPLLSPGDSAVFHIRAVVPASVCGESLLNVAVVRAQVIDIDPTNDRSEVATAVTGRGCTRVSLRKAAIPEVFRVGAADTFRLTVFNNGLVPVGPLVVTDTLPDGLGFVSGSGAGWVVSLAGPIVTGSYVVTGRFAGTLAPGDSSGFDIAVIPAEDAVPRVCNRAAVEADGDPAHGPEAVDSTCVPVEDPRLVIEKMASRDEAEIGDVVDYRLTVFTVDGGLPGVVVTDRLPTGFRYVPGTARVRGSAGPDPEGSPGPVLMFHIGSMASGDTVTIDYRVRVGPGTPLGPGINRAKASGGGEASNDATEVVVIRAGVFSEEGTIIGKVFLDFDAWARGTGAGCDCTWQGDRAQAEGEPGVPGVRVYLQDGTSAITDSEGKFLFYGLSPRSWVVRIDRSSLPDSTFLVAISNRHARDGASLLVDLKMGELHRTDFAVAVPDTATATAMLARYEGGAATLAELESGTPFGRLGSQGAIRTAPAFTEYEPILADPLASGLDRRIRGTGGLPVRLPGLFERADSGSAAAGPVASALANASGGSSVGAPVVPPGLSSTRAAPADGQGGRASDAVPAFRPALQASADPRTWRQLAIGLLEARVDFRSLTDAEFGIGRTRDRFEDRLRSLDFADDDGRVTGGARATLFYRGQVAAGTGLTLRLDTEEDERARLFRDIRPDEFYPVYGDASIREFDAASRSRVFGRLERGASFLSYGDFNTSGGYGQTGSRVLGEYGRTLTGAVEHFENRRAAITAFASRDRSAQVVDVIPGAGISGPYSLSRSDGLINSEHVQLVTRDRNQPAVVLRAETLQRFLDYTVEPFTGRILFRRPVPGVDVDLNPVEIRVTYEIETGGDRFWILGANGQVRPFDRLELGGGIVRDDNPLGRFDLASVNATLALGAGTWLTGELARTDSASTSTGDAARLELRHSSERIAGRLFFLDTDPQFDNPSSAFGRGRTEIGLLAAASLSERNQLFTEFLQTADRMSGAERTGARIGLERNLAAWLRGQVGFRYADDTGTRSAGADSAQTNALGGRLTASLPGARPGSVFAEFEQDVNEADRRRLEVGGDYRVFDGVRLYARHEFLSSLLGPWDPYPGRDRNATVFGLAAGNRSGQAVFSEYRVTDAISGRDAQAAIGLRNSWLVNEGVRLSTSVERLAPVGSGGRSATALTGAAEFTGSPLWKGSARLEYRESAGGDNLFGSFGYARKLSRDFTLLGNSHFSTQLDGGNRAFERSRLGIAWRQTDRNEWNGLARYEHRFDRNPEVAGLETSRSAHVLAAHLDYRPDPRLILRGQWATKFASESSQGVTTSGDAHLAGLRGTLDITDRLDAGVLGRSLFSGSGGTRFGVGAELGLRLADGLRMAAGYNVFGFRDPDLSAEEYTDRGFYVQLGMTFDERLFRGAEPRVSPRACGCSAGRACKQACAGEQACGCRPIADLVVDVDGPTRVGAGESFVVRVTTSNRGSATADATRLQISLPPGARLVAPDWTVLGSTLDRSLGAVAPGASDTVKLVLTALGIPDVLVTTALATTGTQEITVANNVGRETTRVDPVRHGTADLHVRISGPYEKQAGDTMTYWVHAGNLGSDTARYPVLTVDIPADLRFDSAGTFEGGGPRYEVTETGGRVVWVRGRSLEPGGSDSIWVAVRADTVILPDSVRLDAVIRSPSTDPDTSDNRHRFATALTTRPSPCTTGPCPTDIKVELFGPKVVFEPGGTVRYEVRSRHVRGLAAERVELRLLLPEGVVPVEGLVDGAEIRPAERPRFRPGGPAPGDTPWGWDAMDYQAPATLVWRDLGTLPPDSAITKVVTVLAPGSPGTVELEAWTETTNEDSLRNNYTRFPLTVDSIVKGVADIAVRVESPSTARAGSTVRFWIRVNNEGGAPADLVVMNAIPMPGARLVSPGPGEGFDPPTWVAGNLAVGAAPFTRAVDIECPRPSGRISLEAHATTKSREIELRNNRARSVTECVPDPRLADVVVDIIAAGKDGRSVSWLVTAFNQGSVDAEDVGLRVEWPFEAGVTFRSATPGIVSAGRFDWPIVPVLPAFGSHTETIVLDMPAAVIDSLLPRIDAFVTASSESDVTNNRDSSMVLIQDVVIRDTLFRVDTILRVESIPVPFPFPESPWWWPWVPLFLLALIPLAILLPRLWPVTPPPVTPPPVTPPPVTPPAVTPPVTPPPVTPPPVTPPPVTPPFVTPPPVTPPPVTPPPVTPSVTPPPVTPKWGIPIPMIPPAAIDGPVPPEHAIPAACGRIELDDRCGTVWLVEPERFVTCAHLVQKPGVGGHIDIRFGGATQKATVESIDSEADIAILKLPSPIPGIPPLSLSETPRACGRWEGFSWLGEEQGMWLGGAVVNGEAQDRFRGPRVSLTGMHFVHHMLAPGHGLSGAPVVVDGKVVGQISTQVPHPDSLDRSFSCLVYGSTLPRIRKLLGRDPASPCTPPVPRPKPLDACAGERHHAFVLYKGADREFAERLMSRLEGTGVSVLPLQREDPAAAPSPDEQRARASCRYGLVLFSRAWSGDEVSRLELAAEALRQAVDQQNHRIKVLKVDGSAVPGPFTDFVKADFCDAPPDHGSALRMLVDSFMPELDDAARDAWVPIEGVTDDVVRELHEARGIPNRLRFIAKRWREVAVPGHHVPLLAAEFLVEAGRPDWALEALESQPRSIRTRQAEAHALSQLGRTNDLIAAAESLVKESVADARTGTLLGDAYAGLWQESGRKRQAWLTKAFDAYLDCHQRTGDLFAGARAASLALADASLERAREIAQHVRNEFVKRASDPDAWAAAAHGTACLILGERDEARESFKRASGLEPDALARIAVVRDTVRLVLEKLRSQPATAAAADGMDDVIGLPAVALFVGARDHAWEAWRPPAEPDAEEAGRRGIREQLDAHDVGCGVCGLATDADLLFAEEVLARRGLVEIVLPFARDAFLDVWVPPALRPRVEDLLADPRVTVAVYRESMPTADRIEEAVSAATDEAERRARARAAEWGVEPLLLEPHEAGEAPPEATSPAGFREIGIAEWRPEPATRNIKVKRKSGSPPNREPRTYRKRFLVVVGVDKYVEWPPLRNALNDAEGVASTLARDFGFEVRFVRNEEATAERIRAEITEKLAPEVKDEDLVVFFFAGHGHTERAEDGTDHGFLVPVDARRESTEGLLRMEEVVSWTKLLASDDVLYIFDSCFSGFAGMAERVTERGGKFDARVAITAGTTEQPVLDGGAPGDAGNHSVFTGYLLRGLTKDVPDAPGHPFTAMDLFVYLQRQVDEATDGAQTPSCGFLHGHGIGNIWLQAGTAGAQDG